MSNIKPGTYYAPVWIAHKTGNEGFIALDGLIVDNHWKIQNAVNTYKQRLKSFWELDYTGRYVTLRYPEDAGRYPIVEVEEGGTILPFGLMKGPMFDKATKDAKTTP